MKKPARIPNIRDAKRQLSKLVDETAEGGPPVQARLLGFMRGQIAVPEDFDEMGRTEIERLFFSA